MAMTAWDLARQTQGRFLLGLGTQVRGHIVRRFSSYWAGKPAPQLKEYIEAMRAVWDSWQNGTPLLYEGEFYKLSLMTPFFNPGPNPYGAPKVFLAGVGVKMTEVAGEVADGFLAHAFSTPKYLREVTIPALEKAIDDTELRAKADGWLESAAAYVVRHYSGEITTWITDTVERWDGVETSRKIELQVGRDLQFIRINGTIVGAMAGTAIHAIVQLAT